MVASLNKRLEHLVLSLQKKDEEISSLCAERARLENKVDSLLIKVETLEKEASQRPHPSVAQTLARKSSTCELFCLVAFVSLRVFVFSVGSDVPNDGESEQEKMAQLRRQLAIARQQKDEAEQALRLERAAVETKAKLFFWFFLDCFVFENLFSGCHYGCFAAKFAGSERKS
jgi:hypothetical protein